MSAPEGTKPARERRPIPRWRHLFELLALSGFAVAQPLLDLFGRAPEAFILRDASSADIVWFGALVVFAPPVTMWLAVLVVGRVNLRVGEWLHHGLIGLLALLFAIVVLNRVDALSFAVIYVVALLLATLVVFAVARWRWTRDYLMFAAVLPFAVGGLFLFASPTSELIGAPPAKAAEVEIAADAPSIVMLVFDEMPLISMINERGEIDAELFPNLAALAADGAWYRNATTVATATQYAVPSILTGRMPDQDRDIPVAGEHPENLFTLLANRYDIEAIESVTKLCPDAFCDGEFVDDPEAPEAAPPAPTPPRRNALGDLLGDARSVYRAMLDPGSDAGVDADPEANARRDTPTTAPAPTTSTTPIADAVADAANDPTEGGGLGGLVELPELRLDDADTLLAGIETDEGPTLHFLHIQLPHQPYRLLPNGQAYAPAPVGLDPNLIREASAVRGPDPRAADAERHRLILQVGAVDEIVGRTIERLRVTGLYERSVVVVTADHGVGLTPGGPVRALFGDEPIPASTYADILPVPLIVKGVGIEPGTVSDANVMTVDELPTIADLVDVEIPWAIDGRSVLDPARVTPTKQFRKVTAGLGGAGGLGPIVEFDGQVVLADALDRHIDTLLRGDNADHRFYNADDAGELIGRPLTDVTLGAPSALEVVIDAPEMFDAVDPRELVPAHVHGTPPGDAPLTIAFALDGFIVGVTTSYVDEGRAQFDTVLAPDRFREGENRLTIYLVEGSEGSRVLHPTAVPSGR